MSLQETKTIELKLYELRILHAKRFKSTQAKKFQNMTVTVETRQVVITGKKSDVAAAEKAMFVILKDLKSSSIKMSDDLIRLMKGITMIRHVVDLFRGKDIFAVYADADDGTLGVYAFAEEDTKKAIDVIRNGTDKQCVDAASARTLQTREWDDLKDELQSKYRGLLAINQSGSHVTISGTVDEVTTAKEAILGLLKRHPGGSPDDTDDMSCMVGSTTIDAFKGDLTTFPADAIVSAANEVLNNTAGLANALVNAGMSFFCVHLHLVMPFVHAFESRYFCLINCHCKFQFPER